MSHSLNRYMVRRLVNPHDADGKSQIEKLPNEPIRRCAGLPDSASPREKEVTKRTQPLWIVDFRFEI
jgi:hypothetical protein